MLLIAIGFFFGCDLIFLACSRWMSLKKWRNNCKRPMIMRKITSLLYFSLTQRERERDFLKVLMVNTSGPGEVCMIIHWPICWFTKTSQLWRSDQSWLACHFQVELSLMKKFIPENQALEFSFRWIVNRNTPWLQHLNYHLLRYSMTVIWIWLLLGQTSEINC